jgi:hypothetical protein
MPWPARHWSVYPATHRCCRERISRHCCAGGSRARAGWGDASPFCLGASTEVHPKRLRPRCRPHPRLARRRQRQPHRGTAHLIPASQLPDRESLDPRIPPDPREQLHPRPHPPSTTDDQTSFRPRWGGSGLNCPRYPEHQRMVPLSLPGGVPLKLPQSIAPDADSASTRTTSGPQTRPPSDIRSAP